jgi:hypothetical protein
VNDLESLWTALIQQAPCLERKAWDKTFPWPLLAVITDYCEEQGKDVTTLRLLVKKRKRPIYQVILGRTGYFWFPLRRGWDPATDPSSDLPQAVYRLLLNPKKRNIRPWYERYRPDCWHASTLRKAYEVFLC